MYLDRSRIRDGRVEELRAAITGLVAFIQEREPQLLYYGFHIDEEASRMTVVAVHPDAESLDLHMKVGGEAFGHFSRFIEMDGIEVYGEPGQEATEALRAKAKALGPAASVVVRPSTAGFTRIGSASVSFR